MKEYLSQDQIRTGNLILVSARHPLGEAKAPGLVPALPGFEDILLAPQAAKALLLLTEDLGCQGQIVPVSGWRSPGQQRQIYEDSLAENGPEFTRQFVALPGCSEHQTGLAIDLGLSSPRIDFIRPDFPYRGICQAFREKAPSYGFIQRYRAEWEPVTGIAHEPWHFRYVGRPHACLMTHLGLSLEEYLDFLTGYPLGSPPLLCQSGGAWASLSYLPLSALAEPLTQQQLAGRSSSLEISGDNKMGFILTRWE